MMTEIVMHGVLASAPGAGLAMKMVPSEAGVIVAMLLGLAGLSAFLWQVLLTPVEEERPAAYRSAIREPSPPERYRLRGLRLLGQLRHR